MKIVGLTGGIGSGKSTVAKWFESYGIPVYIADKAAKELMQTSCEIKKQLQSLLGIEAYVDGQLNRPYIASRIFTDTTLLSQINAIVHPQVALHFKTWVTAQTAPYVIKEAAIIFENNLQEQYDYIITVVADESQRIKRVISRDNSSETKVKSIIKQQWTDEEKIKQSDFVIYNNDLKSAQKATLKIHKALLSL